MKQEQTFIDVYIIEKCNLHCPYCYNRRAHNGREMQPENYSKVFELVERCPFNPVPNLLGGEPLLKKDLNSILDLLRKTKANQIEVTTNGTLPIWKINNFDRVKVIFSWHPKHPNTNLQRFEKNINYCINNNIDYQISLSIFNNTDEILYFIKKYRKNKLHFNYIKMDDDSLDVYLDKYSIGGKLVNERLINKFKLNRFKDYQCFTQWYNIDIDGNLRRACDNVLTNFTDSCLCQVDYCKGGMPALISAKVREKQS